MLLKQHMFLRTVSILDMIYIKFPTNQFIRNFTYGGGCHGSKNWSRILISNVKMLIWLLYLWTIRKPHQFVHQ
jgi:hypothetical protein